MQHIDTTVAVFHLLGLKRPPWLVLGLVLLAALVSRSVMFLIAMIRHRKDE